MSKPICGTFSAKFYLEEFILNIAILRFDTRLKPILITSSTNKAARGDLSGSVLGAQPPPSFNFFFSNKDKDCVLIAMREPYFQDDSLNK